MYAAISDELEEVTGAFLASSRVVSFRNTKHAKEDIDRLIDISAELSGIPWDTEA
jgi:hypothetical protein